MTTDPHRGQSSGRNIGIGRRAAEELSRAVHGCSSEPEHVGARRCGRPGSTGGWPKPACRSPPRADQRQVLRPASQPCCARPKNRPSRRADAFMRHRTTVVRRHPSTQVAVARGQPARAETTAQRTSICIGAAGCPPKLRTYVQLSSCSSRRRDVRCGVASEIRRSCTRLRVRRGHRHQPLPAPAWWSRWSGIRRLPRGAHRPRRRSNARLNFQLAFGARSTSGR